MKRALLISALTVAAFAAIVLAFVLRGPGHPVALIEVTDPAGRPIAGAVITPDGLRPKRGGGHYLWDAERAPRPASVITDAKGSAAVPYPFYTEERLETGEISFLVEHPDFCSDRPFRTVNAAPPGNARFLERAFFWANVLVRNVQVRPSPVVLKPGAVVEVSGYFDQTNHPAMPLFPQVSGLWSPGTKLWREPAPGWLATRKVTEGPHVLRLVHAAPNGQLYFSEAVSFQAIPEQTNRFHLRLEPGCRFRGQLDRSVPRPVTGGRAVLEVRPADSAPRADTVVWHAWSPIDTNGAFVLDGLPPGRVEIVALCDGYVSQDGARVARGLARAPQPFTLGAGEVSVELAMEPAATFELKASDDRGQPLPGAKVDFWPNVIWGDAGTTIFCSDLHDTAGWLTNSGAARENLRTPQEVLYSATTDRQGIAVVSNLPANANAYAVSHPDFEIPVRTNRAGQATRDRPVRLRPGETVRQTVTLQKRGTDHLEHKQ